MLNSYVQLLKDYRTLVRVASDMRGVAKNLMDPDSLLASAEEVEKIAVLLRDEVIAAGGEEDLINDTVRGHAQ